MSLFQDIADRCDLSLLCHTAVLKSLSLKRHDYGKFWLGIESFFHVMLTIVCTVSNFVGKSISSDMPVSDPNFIVWLTFLFAAQFMINLRAATVSVMFQLQHYI